MFHPTVSVILLIALFHGNQDHVGISGPSTLKAIVFLLRFIEQCCFDRPRGGLCSVTSLKKASKIFTFLNSLRISPQYERLSKKT